ncbi:ankyrin repeat domain-containing protein [Phytohabitans houttuyneae]|uniref:Uncharacterized protein n=1 Tax=Phytohabitans houttuyneae TaxID=1076126 RepID=A0A6V8K7U8_9ACTN|nr:ankyrin repeat domain-containing protein [Phytohabitans houttuyneae]GFJ76875.1 hypothetical protein Phou_010550 [Phytohabitans houttuyneae]
MTGGEGGWARMGYRSWGDLTQVRARLAAGADPEAELGSRWRPLHLAAEWGTAEVVAALIAAGADVEADHEGRSPLWIAVQAGQAGSARALAAAGADPWRPMMAGWSPGRLSLAGRTPDLFDRPPGAPGLTDAERAAAAEGHRLVDAIGTPHYDGLSLCCAAGIDATEAVRRLDAAEVPGDPDELVRRLSDDPMGEETLLTVGVTDVEGGCVVTQPWAYGAATPVVCRRLSEGTFSYGMYANPKSGNQGRATRDGEVVAWDLHPGGGWSSADDTAGEILHTFLYRFRALASCCAHAGLRLTDARPIVGPPDRWVRLPPGDYWAR